ncbi:TPA: glycosyltransferase, partial [Vibrio cholerae]|nr:glycosyltransferase family 4 protein [Vibrio cholerae]
QLKNEMVKTQDNKIKLVTCALISRRKRVDLILALLKEIRKSGRDVTLNIIGPNVDPVYYSELEMLIKKWELSDNVLFLGRLNQKEIIQQYQDADVGVFLSDQETFGLAPLEMLAAGLPLIATSVGILGERKDTFSKLGVTYYSNEQIENIACSIDSILYRDMRKAQDYIRSHFSAQGVLEQYESLYDEVIR